MRTLALSTLLLAAATGAWSQTHPANPPLPKPTTPVARPASRTVPSLTNEQRKRAEAEALSAQLLQENARLTQELARAQGISNAPVTTPEAAMAELKAGNARFVSGNRIRTLFTMQDAELRTTLTGGQSPFAIIVTCSDSRVADNLLFDQELGRLFTIREAGNSPDTQGLASIEYAVEHLGSKIVVILGHTSCGAVGAVKDSHGHMLPGNLWSLQAAMAGLLESTPMDPNEHASAYANRLAAANAVRQAQAVMDRSEIVRHFVTGGKVKVVPALYDLASGQVQFLDMPAVTTPGKH